MYQQEPAAAPLESAGSRAVFGAVGRSSRRWSHADPYDVVGGWVKRFVRWWRRQDAWYLRPLPRGRARAWELLAPSDYPWFIPALAAVLVFGVTVGPRPWHWSPVTAGLLGLGLLLMLALHAWARRSEKVRIRILKHYLAILVLLGGLLVAIATTYGKGGLGPEAVPLSVHVGPALAILVAAMLAGASAMAGTVAKRIDDEPMPVALPRVELFQPKNRGDFMGDTPRLALFSIFFLVPLRYPMQLLLPPALATLLVPSHWVGWAAAVMLALAWAALYAGILYDRLMEILKTVGRLCFVGPQRILTAIVIGVAAARWAGVHYINYLFDSPGGNWTVLSYILFTYAVAWFYGFWCDILLARRFIRLLSDADGRPMAVPYAFDGDDAVTRVANAGRTITLHGAGRLMVAGEYDDAYRRQEHIPEGENALTFLTPAEVLADMRTQLEDHGWDKRQWGPDPLPRVRDLQRGVSAYPGVTGLLALVCIGVPLWIGYAVASQPAELDIVWDGHVNLSPQPLLFGAGPASPPGGCQPLGPDDPRIAVAASGGGTRAAIYTAAVLRGLAMEDRICNVVLASGVSGGSAALAYFAVNEDALRVPLDRFDADAWKAFDDAMAKSYIQEVLNGASDAAVIFGSWQQRGAVCKEFEEAEDNRDTRSGGWWPARVRFGNLLAESFVCEMSRAHRDAEPGTFGRMDQVGFGLILNTGLAAEFPAEVHDPAYTVAEQARQERGKPVRRSDVAGGRLILTNLPDPSAARRMSEKEGTRDLRFITINDPEMSVARAAALSANFPPVFADAAIDERRSPELDRCRAMPAERRKAVCKDVRYWVSDGGTVENRGAVTLYLAVMDALNARVPGDPRANWEGRSPVFLHGTPPLHVVIADVSAVGGPYTEGVGLGPVQAAGSQMGLALEAQLLAGLRAGYARRGGTVTVHELPMPRLLRDAIGTHWMMPNGLGLTDPSAPESGQSLSREQALALVSSLFTAPAGASDPEVERVRPWLFKKRTESETTAAEAWSALVSALRAPDARVAHAN